MIFKYKVGMDAKCVLEDVLKELHETHFENEAGHRLTAFL